MNAEQWQQYADASATHDDRAPIVQTLRSRRGRLELWLDKADRVLADYDQGGSERKRPIPVPPTHREMALAPCQWWPHQDFPQSV